MKLGGVIVIKSNNVEFVLYCGGHFENGMVTARNFSTWGINSRHHNLPIYEMSLKSDNVEFVRYCDGHSTLSDFNDISYMGRL
jgi:hypothetical protein